MIFLNGLHIIEDPEHDHGKCHICFIFNDMANDAIVLKIPNIDFNNVEIDYRYTFYSEYTGSSLSRAPPSSSFT